MDVIESPEQSYLELREPTFYRTKEKLLWLLLYQGIPSILFVVSLPLVDRTLTRWMPYILGYLGFEGMYHWPTIRQYALALFLIYTWGFAAIITYFLPYLGAGRRIARHFSEPGGFVVQARFNPRRYKGFIGSLEDADDLGLLRVEGGKLIFKGDGSEFEIRREDIVYVESRNVGWRMLWLGGKETRIGLKEPLEGISEIVFCSREAMTLPAMRRLNRAIENAVREWVG